MKDEKIESDNVRKPERTKRDIQDDGRKKSRLSRKQERYLIVGGGVIFLAFASLFFYLRWYNYLAGLFGVLLLGGGYLFARKKMQRYADIRKMEDVFPDFISLMASNLRAGLTIDKAMLMSARKEFEPLDKEITNMGKDIVTGKDINVALEDMARRTESDEIKKTVKLIVSGIRSGGNLSVLLEQVSSNMRERSFVKKRASSNVLMYVIFIFFAVAFGAPLLFGLSSVLVGVLTSIVANVPQEQAVSVNVPFVLSSVNISVTFIIYFSLTFIITSDIFAAFVLGLVSKGRERDGVKYIIPLILLGVSSFFLSRFILLRYFPSFAG